MEASTLKKRLRYLRFACYVLVLIPIAHFSIKYDIDEIPAGYDKLTTQKMPPGTKIVLTDCNDDTVIGLGTVVLYRPPGSDSDQMLFGVVSAMPGETIEYQEFEDNVAVIKFGDREVEMPIPGTLRLLPGTVPENHYVLINGDRLLGPENRHPDSRVLGPIDRSRFVKKVVVPLTFL